MEGIFKAGDACGNELRRKKQRIATIESTTGGLIGGRGYKTFLPASVLEDSGVMDRENNYKGKKSYVESKIKFVTRVALQMKDQYKADWLIVESGTSGPKFYVPGVESGFTAIAIAGPPDPKTGAPLVRVKLFESGLVDRKQNMLLYAQQSLYLLRDTLIQVNNDREAASKL